jgi:serine/threonine protein phosphatase PrpC
MWKFLCESIEGTSHRQANTGCQDSAFASPYRMQNEEIIILACSDGAGSATHAQIGSKVACESAVQHVTKFFDAGGRVEDINIDTLRSWTASVHANLVAEAERQSVPPRELACTLLLAAVGPSNSAYVQIGDGAIVVLDAEQYRPVFWPQSGEYQNTTFFLTEAEFDEHLQLEVTTRSVEELAMFTDGLQMLALNYTTRTAHQPFFTQLFQALRVTPLINDLVVPMRQFLDSKPVNDRTDDDKTLILATRVASADTTL